MSLYTAENSFKDVYVAISVNLLNFLKNSFAEEQTFEEKKVEQ